MSMRSPRLCVGGSCRKRFVGMPLGPVVALVFVMSTFAGCEGVRPSATPIGEIRRSPEQYHGTVVRIQGTVTDVGSIVIVPVSIFVVADATGTLLVVTEAAPPGVGRKILVTGVLNSLVAFGDRRIGLHLNETERR